MKKNKIINIGFIFIAIVFIACGSSLEQIKPKEDYETAPDVSVENMESIFTSSAKMKAKIKTPLMHNYARLTQPYTEFPEGILIWFYDENMNIISSLTADYAVYYTKKKLWKASKNVYINNLQGGSLQTDEIFGDEVARKIYSLQYVKVIDRDSSIIEGKGGFVSNFEFTEYEFKNVSGILEQEIDSK